MNQILKALVLPVLEVVARDNLKDVATGKNLVNKSTAESLMMISVLAQNTPEFTPTNAPVLILYAAALIWSGVKFMRNQ